MIPLRAAIRSLSAPSVTILLIAVNTLVFLYMISLDPYTLNHFIRQYAMVPSRLHVSTIVTMMFLHGGWMHLIGNMWFLWVFGDNVEDVLGHGKYLLFYLLCGVIAAVTQYAISPDSRVPVLGASGAIAGVMGAYLVKFPNSRILTLLPLFVFWTTVEMPAWVMLVYWFVLQFFSGLGSIGYSQGSTGGVAFFAHVGGFIAGMLLILVIATRDRYSRRSDLAW